MLKAPMRPMQAQHHAMSSLYRTTPHYVGDSTAADMDADPGGVLFGTEAPTSFATTESLSRCAQYLEPILRDLGLKQCQLLEGDAVAAINCLYDLVQQHQRMQEGREQVQEQLHKVKVDVKVANKTIQRLQGQVEAKEQEVGALNIKLRQLDSWYRDETERWGNEREELCKKCGQLEQRHVQFQHELRRRDAEFERLQKHLAGQVAATERRRRTSSSGSGASSAASSSSMVLTSAGAGSRHGSRGPAASTKAGSSSQLDTKRISKAELEDLYKRSVEVFESEKQTLESDNAALRKALHSLEREHMELLNKNHSGARCSAAGNSSDCRAGLSSSSNSANSDSGTTQLPGGSSGSPSAAMQSAAALAAADPAAALHRMHANLQALKVRKQRVTGGTPLTELQQQAESASERLLLAKLQEAGRIMEEQESALALALKAVSGHKDQQGD